jgi:hypothetical protein
LSAAMISSYLAGLSSTTVRSTTDTSCRGGGVRREGRGAAEGWGERKKGVWVGCHSYGVNHLLSKACLLAAPDTPGCIPSTSMHPDAPLATHIDSTPSPVWGRGRPCLSACRSAQG